MAVPLSGPGGYFTRIGKLKGILDAINASRGSAVPGKVAALVSDLASGDQPDASLAFSGLAGYQSAAGSYLATLKAIAANVTIAMVNGDAPQTDQTLATALAALRAQMVAGSQTVQACAVSASASAAGTNAGNPVVVAGVKTSSGRTAENLFAESIAGACTADSQSGGTTALREPIQFKGLPPAPDTSHYSYPAGSGTSNVLNCVDALIGQQGGANNYLNNGSFEVAGTPNLPDGWHAVAGSPGSQILQSTAQHYDGAACLQLVGDGSTGTSLYQAFGVDTTQRLGPGRQYAFCLWARVSVAPAAGALEVALTDGSDAVVSDDSASANSAITSLVSLGTTWVAIRGTFRTPRVLPPALRLRLKLSTPLSAGTSVFLDRLALTAMTQLYLGGPSLAVFSGSTPMVLGDSFTVVAANNYGGAIQRAMDALLPMRQLGLTLPSASSSPTISDGLVA